MPTPLLEIRDARYDSPEVTAMVAVLQDYYHSIYHGHDDDPVDTDRFAPPAGRFFVGYAAGAPLAMGGWRWLEPMPAISAERPVEIKRMFVAPEQRGHGHARLMLAHLESTAAGAGADAVVLSTGRPQVEAIGLYRASGYVDIPKFGYYARYEKSVHLGKLLTAE